MGPLERFHNEPLPQPLGFQHEIENAEVDSDVSNDAQIESQVSYSSATRFYSNFRSSDSGDTISSGEERENDEVDSDVSNDAEFESQASDSSATSFYSNFRSSDSGDTISSSEERDATTMEVEVSQRPRKMKKKKKNPFLMNYIGKRAKRGDFVATNHRPFKKGASFVKADRCALVAMFWGDDKYYQRKGSRYYFAPALLGDRARWWQNLSAKERENIMFTMKKKVRHYGHFAEEAARDLMHQFKLRSSDVRCLRNRELETVGIYGRFDGIKLGIMKVPEWNCTGFLIVLEDYNFESANSHACIEKCSFVTAVRKKNSSRWSSLILGNYPKGNLCIEPCVEALNVNKAISVNQAAKLIRENEDKMWIRFRRFQDRKEKGRPPINEQLCKRIDEMMQ